MATTAVDLATKLNIERSSFITVDLKQVIVSSNLTSKSTSEILILVDTAADVEETDTEEDKTFPPAEPLRSSVSSSSYSADLPAL